MGRRRKYRLDLPRRLYFCPIAKQYYFKPKHGSKIWYGADLGAALVEYIKLIEQPSPQGTMGQLFDQYIRLELPRKGPRTQSDERDKISRLRRVFEHVPANQITTQDCVEYHVRRSRGDLPVVAPAPVRANREINLLSRVFRFAINVLRMPLSNPCRDVKKNPEVGRDRSPEMEELELFKRICLEQFGDRQTALYVDLKTVVSLRMGDMLKLRRDMIKEHALIVEINKSTKMGKATKKQEFRFRDDEGRTTGLKELLDEILALPRPVGSMHVFCRERDGRRYTVDGFKTNWQRRMSAFVKAGGVRFTEHDIRATAADEMAKGGGDPTALLAHSDPKTTQIYLRKRRPIQVIPMRRRRPS
jgi:integrase